MQKLTKGKIIGMLIGAAIAAWIGNRASEFVRALLAHRFQAMTDYQRNVLKPALREEAAAAGAKVDADAFAARLR